MTKLQAGEIEINFKSSYSEITVGEMIRLRKMKNKEDFSELFSIISDKDLEFWKKHDLTIESFELIMSSLGWVSEVPDFNTLPVTKQITIEGKVYDIPEDLFVKRLDQHTDFLKRAFTLIRGEDIIDSIAVSVAIYMQPYITEKDYDSDSLDKTIKTCEGCLLMEAYPVAAFFLKKYLGLKAWKQTLNIPENKNSQTQELENSSSSESST